MAIKKKSGLGRGLGALIPQASAVSTVLGNRGVDAQPNIGVRESALSGKEAGVLEVSLSQIEANPNQPRTAFSHQGMEELAESVRKHGILQPLAVSPKQGGGYEVIAGERRLRAAKMAGLKSVPVLVRRTTETDKLVLALIENIQREDLNPIEEARAYRRLTDDFGMTQEDVSKQVGKARSTVANMMRLLELPEEVMDAVATGAINAGNARALLAVGDPKMRMKMFRKMLSEGMTVREAEAGAQKVSVKTRKDPELLAVEEELRRKYGTRVSVSKRHGQGKVELRFYSEEEFDGLLKKLLA